MLGSVSNYRTTSSPSVLTSHYDLPIRTGSGLHGELSAPLWARVLGERPIKFVSDDPWLGGQEHHVGFPFSLKDDSAIGGVHPGFSRRHSDCDERFSWPLIRCRPARTPALKVPAPPRPNPAGIDQNSLPGPPAGTQRLDGPGDEVTRLHPRPEQLKQVRSNTK